MPTYNITMSLECFQDIAKLPPPIVPRAMRAATRIVEDPWATELHPEKVRQAEAGIHASRVDPSYRPIMPVIASRPVMPLSHGTALMLAYCRLCDMLLRG